MQPRWILAAACCWLAVSAFLCTAAAPSAFAKPSVVEKSSAGGKKATVTSKKKKKGLAAKKRKSKSAAKSAAKSVPAAKPEPRTPTDKQDCIAVAQAYFREAGRLSKQTKQDTPRGFVRVISKLSELCGEEEFDKARTSIDWMDGCLRDFGDKQKDGFCASDAHLLCTVDPESKSCATNGKVAGQ